MLENREKFEIKTKLPYLKNKSKINTKQAEKRSVRVEIH